MTLSMPVKIVGLAGALCALGLVGVVLLLAGKGHSTTPAQAQQQSHRPVVRSHAAPHPVRAAPTLSPGLPAPLRRALLRSHVAVAVLFAPGIAADTDVVAAAREGAHATGVGFAALDVASPAVANALHGWLPAASDPAVLVVKRPGQVVAELDGWSDSTMVAEAVANTR